jgi:MFS family permease
MFRALRHRNFRYFLSGQAISLIGTWMQMVAQSWLVYRLTNSALLLGAAGFASQIPILFLGPVAGILADRHPRRQIVIATQCAMMVQALIMAVLTLTGAINVLQIFILASLLGVCNAFDIPARQSFIVEMVGTRDLMNAIALNSSMFNAARSVGPAVAGLLVASLGEGICFLINGLSFLAVIACLLLIRVERSAPQHGKEGTLLQFKAGLAYVWSNPAIRALLLLLALVSLLAMPYAVLMPIFADRILNTGARGLGQLLTSAGVGALIGALWLTRRRNARGLDLVLARAAAAFGVSLMLFAISRTHWISVTVLLWAGFSVMVQLASTNTLIQSIVTDSVRGRVMGIYSMMFLGMAPFGSLLAGFVAQRLGAPTAVFLSGSAAVAGAAIFAVRRRSLRIDEHLLQATPVPLTPDPIKRT